MKKKPDLIIFGEILADCFPDGQQILGGAPFNVAWHLQAFNVNPLMISSVGNDSLGSKIINSMEQWGMNTSAINIDSEHPTGKVDVRIKNNEPSYHILENCAWDNIPLPADINLNNQRLYFGTLALRNTVSRHTLDQIRFNHSSLFIDINLRPPWYDINSIIEYIRHTSWLKLNSSELDELVPQFKRSSEKLSFLHNEYEINHIILTQGEYGACLSRANGIEAEVSPKETTKIVDTVGAGDAFSSVMLLGIIKQWSTQTTLERAQQFASLIVAQKGATVSDITFYTDILTQW